MNRTRFRSTSMMLTPLFILGLFYFTDPVKDDGPESWHEECVSEGSCSTEELHELYEDYSEECLNEGCDTEELNEDAGGAQYIDEMLEAFLAAGWVVEAKDFQSSASPSSNWVWLYEACSYEGRITAINSNVSSMPNGFNDRTLAMKLGPSVESITVYIDDNYNGNSQTLNLSQSCLTTSYPTFANSISSIKVTD